MSRIANNALLGSGVRVRVWIREQRRLDYTVQFGGTRLVYPVHQTLPSLVEVTCETNRL